MHTSLLDDVSCRSPRAPTACPLQRTRNIQRQVLSEHWVSSGPILLWSQAPHFNTAGSIFDRAGPNLLERAPAFSWASSAGRCSPQLTACAHGDKKQISLNVQRYLLSLLFLHLLLLLHLEARAITSYEALSFSRRIRTEDDGNGDAGGTHATEKSARVAESRSNFLETAPEWLRQLSVDRRDSYT